MLLKIQMIFRTYTSYGMNKISLIGITVSPRCLCFRVNCIAWVCSNKVLTGLSQGAIVRQRGK